MAEAPGAINRAQQTHQDAERTNGVKPVGVRRETAHGMKGDRVAGHGAVFVFPHIGPGNGEFDLLVARGHPHLIGQTADGLCRNTGNAGSPFRGIRLNAFCQ